MDVDEVLTTIVGEYGPAQRRYFWALAWGAVASAVQSLHMVFIGAEPFFMCAHGLSQSPGCAKAGAQCAHYKFPGRDFTSIVSEWSLVCDDKYKVGAVQSVFMVGFMIGCLVFANIADRRGRRFALYGSIFALFWTTLTGAYAPTYYIYVAVRFLSGILTGGYGLVSFIMATELLGPSTRGFCGMVFPAMFAIGICVYSATAYYIREWRMLTLACAVPCLIGFYFYWAIPESPRWLLSNGKVSDAGRILEGIARANTGKGPDRPIVLKAPSKNSPAKSQGIKILILNPILRRRTFVCCITGFVSSAVYFGMTLSSGTLGSNIYVSVSLSGFIELPAYVLALGIIDRYGRRPTFIWTFFLASLPCLAILATRPDSSIGPISMPIALGLIGKMGISIVASVAFLYAAELYPTTCRNNGLAVVTMACRIGGAAAPMLLPLSRIYPSLEYGVYGIMTFLAGLAACLLPETVGMPLPETIDDITPQRTLLRQPAALKS